MTLQTIYSEFQSQKTIHQKIGYLYTIQMNNLDSNFNINITNLISAWTKKL
jgi:hypothetical protein